MLRGWDLRPFDAEINYEIVKLWKGKSEVKNFLNVALY